jgi:HEAT repeat protein
MPLTRGLTLLLFCLVGASLSSAPLRAQGKTAPPTLNELQKSWEAEDATPASRYQTALRIGSLGTPEAITYLLEKFEAEKDQTLRSYLMRGLARKPRAEGVANLILQVAETPGESFGVRSAALSAIRDLNVDWLGWYLRFASQPNQSNYCSTIVRACARSRDEAAWVALETLDSKGALHLRAAVTSSGANYFDLERFYPRFVKPHLKRRSHPTLKNAALQVLGRAGDERFLDELDRLSEEELDINARSRWIRLLAKFDSPRALKKIRRLAKDCSSRGPVVDAILLAAFEMKDPEVRAWFREKGLKQKEAHWQRAALESMRGTPDASNLRPLLYLVRRGDDITSLLAVQILGHQPREAVEETLRELREHRDLHLAAEAMAAHYHLARGDRSVAQELAEIAKRSSKWQLRVAAMETLMRRDAALMREALRENATHEKAPVRSMAYESLTWLRERETVDFLIERLGSEEGRGLIEASEALTDLTDFHWGPNQERWISWWSKVRDGYPLPPKKELVKKKKKAGAGRYGRFYGLDVDSKRVVFVIDTSGSMTARTNATSGVTRIERAKRELATAIGGFKTDHRFQIVAFSTAPRLYGKRLVRATKRERKKATEWVSKLNAGGGTNVYDSLIDALDMKDVDTIFLLSDGGPSAGEIIDSDEIRVAIKRKNRFLRINIHTIGIGVQGQTETFLRELARENWGESVTVD